MLHKPRHTDDDDKDGYTSYLIHHFSPLFEERLSSFAHMNSITDTPSQFVNFYLNSINAGSFYLTDDTTLWYAPGIYEGYLYRFRKENQRMTGFILLTIKKNRWSEWVKLKVFDHDCIRLTKSTSALPPVNP
jgi:hypothetical protein